MDLCFLSVMDHSCQMRRLHNRTTHIVSIIGFSPRQASREVLIRSVLERSVMGLRRMLDEH